MKLTHKQKRFAEEYVKSGNATQAAINAGYSAKTAYRTGADNLKKTQIKSYINKLSNRLKENSIMDAQEALKLLTGIARGEIKETVYVSTGVSVYEKHKEADMKTRITAIREIMKRYPLTDPMIKEQLRKTKAEADILEAKASLLAGNTNDTESMLQGFLEKLEGGIDESERSVHTETDGSSKNRTE